MFQPMMARSNVSSHTAMTSTSCRPSIHPTHIAEQRVSIIHLNARSILPKTTELVLIANTLKPDIIAVTETWLSPSVPDGALLLPTYNTIIRSDRTNSGPSAHQRGGGVLLLIHDSIKCTLRADLRFWEESVWIELQLQSNRALIVGCLYRSPSSDANSLAEALEKTIDRIELGHAQLVLVGDFNAKSPSWLPSDKYNTAGRILEPAFLQLGLDQRVVSPTHLHPDGSFGSLLDLVLVSPPTLMSTISTHPPLGSSDHLCVYCELAVNRINRTERCAGRRIWNYDKADFAKVNIDLAEANWNAVNDSPDVDSALSSWQSNFLSIINKHIPSKFLKKIKPKNPFVTKPIENAIKEKRAALRKLKKNPSPENREAFKRKRNVVTHLLRKSARAHATSLRRGMTLQPSPTTSQDFWRHVKSIQGKVKRNIIPDLTDPTDNSVARSSVEKASLLNSFFCQQTVLPNASTSVPDTNSLPTNTHTFEKLSCTPRDVFNILSTLKIGKAPGIDGLPSRLLRLCASGISGSLSNLFNRSFNTASFPVAWKMALVVPVFKKGDRSVLGNYRPIALLPILSKVLERHVHNTLSRFLSPWLNRNQSGFRRKDGTVPQLTRVLQEWSNIVDNGKYVASVFFDLRKAFDRVWHEGLLSKLQAAGVTGLAHKWFTNFLSNRYQATTVDGSVSPPARLHAGVPQGAILSPLLFTVFMNDIPSNDSTNLFADDTSSFVTDASASSLCMKLQVRADNLCEWFSKWLLSVNSEKSAVVVFRSRKMPPVQTHIYVNSSVIPQVICHRHLGIFLNETLSWSDHVSHVISKASARIGFLRRLSGRLDHIILQNLYITCIRPSLEYGSIVWAGLSKGNAKRLERCNRSAARLITKARKPSSDDALPSDLLLARAGIQPLCVRRSAAQAKFCLQAIKRRLPVHLQEVVNSWFPSPSSHNMTQRRASLRLPRPKKNVLRFSPLYSAFSTWNSLPLSLKERPSTAAINAYFNS